MNTSSATRPIKLMIVDDSAVVRGLMTRWIDAEPDMELVASATDGVQALKKVVEAQPDVLILDIEMPNMNGLEALPQLLKAKPGLKVLMASTLTTRGATIAIKALELGAADYVPKPDAGRLGGADGYRQELLGKARALTGRSRAFPAPPGATPPPPSPLAARPATSPAAPTAAATSLRVAQPNQVRRIGPVKADVLVVGASTGGPPALRNFLVGLGNDWNLPILIVQHMPATFTAILAEHLNKALPFEVVEAKDGMVVQSKHVYIAPGDFHMTVKREGVQNVLRLDQGPQVNWCRPAVDPMFNSAANIWGEKILAVILTGMGHDGRDGAATIANKGGMVMAQDEATSVVWGMPGAVAEAGLAEIIRPIEGLAAACKAVVRGERP